MRSLIQHGKLGLVVEKETSRRTFVTAGQAVLRFLTPNSTFAASWWLTVK